MGRKREKEEEGGRKKKGRRPCCVQEGVTKGAWTADEDKILVDFITKNGHGTWRNLPQLAGLLRCGKSCRLRWTNYLRPDIRRGPFTHLRKRFDSKVLDQLSSSSKSVDTKSGSSNYHVVQWESVRLEAESRLSRAGNDTRGDYFIHLWNSEVGEAFRNINECNRAASHSPTSQSSSLTKVEQMNDKKVVEVWRCKKEEEEAAAFSDTSKSYEVDDSSDAMMKMLLDFPVGGNDMAFLEAP